ncbi:hypothetical protein [Aliidiomarina maris]|uniref:Uncharacterized protein n=1 Tax=Aliidiomarina maris TaxID=531312 RepID=A0A327WRF1_9GAMM|nr:hypothetical protein [Aliidiomarina maris]RAJ95332.1 hypothetical protein B0I24_11014 [Aliidiomarina maris]RUO22774.1 hypothetical protein CWE07_10965 [Aliidiomarina maris]
MAFNHTYSRKFDVEPNDFLKAHATELVSVHNPPHILCLADGEGRGTGGPPQQDLMVSLDELQVAFPYYDVTLGQEIVRDIQEGEGHTGPGAVCQYLGSKPQARDRIYQVSSTRSKASRRLRYVESSAPEVGECKFCIGSLADKE